LEPYKAADKISPILHDRTNFRVLSDLHMDSAVHWYWIAQRVPPCALPSIRSFFYLNEIDTGFTNKPGVLMNPRDFFAAEASALITKWAHIPE